MVILPVTVGQILKTSRSRWAVIDSIWTEQLFAGGLIRIGFVWREHTLNIDLCANKRDKLEQFRSFPWLRHHIIQALYVFVEGLNHPQCCVRIKLFALELYIAEKSVVFVQLLFELYPIILEGHARYTVTTDEYLPTPHHFHATPIKVIAYYAEWAATHTESCCKPLWPKEFSCRSIFFNFPTPHGQSSHCEMRSVFPHGRWSAAVLQETYWFVDPWPSGIYSIIIKFSTSQV